MMVLANNYFNTKLNLFKMIKEDRKCIINYDNKYGKMIDKKINKENCEKNGDNSWKKMVDKSIHDEIQAYLN